MTLFGLPRRFPSSGTPDGDGSILGWLAPVDDQVGVLPKHLCIPAPRLVLDRDSLPQLETGVGFRHVPLAILFRQASKLRDRYIVGCLRLFQSRPPELGKLAVGARRLRVRQAAST